MATYLGQNKVSIKGGITMSTTGTDTSDATATATDILSGKTAYVNGSKVTGTIASQASQTITPGTSNKTIASGKYLSGTQTIKGDSNLVASNIKNGVSIFGVTGTYTGSSSTTSNNNCEAYIITSTSDTVNFETSTGTIKAWGYGASSSGYTTTLYAFCGDKYYKSATYGSPTSTSLSLSISNGAISGLPTMTSCNLLITRGV